jgi:hypothetical protein
LGESLWLRVKRTQQQAPRVRILIRNTLVHLKDMFVIFCREQRLHASAFGGQKLRASHQRLNEGHYVDAYTWQHLIGVSKGGLVM